MKFALGSRVVVTEPSTNAFGWASERVGQPGSLYWVISAHVHLRGADEYGLAAHIEDDPEVWYMEHRLVATEIVDPRVMTIPAPPSTPSSTPAAGRGK